MKENGFYYNGKGYNVSSAEWLTSQKDCQTQKRCGEDFRKCEGLVVHCCKHVIYGTDHEKQLYTEVTERLGIDGSIPAVVRSQNDPAVGNYRTLSRQLLLDTQAISLCGEGTNLRVACEGDNDTEGLVDYLTFSDNELGVISSYFNFSSPEFFSMLRLIKQRYIEHRDEGKGVSCVPVRTLKDFGKWRAFQAPTADYAFMQTTTLYSGEDDHHLARAAFAIFCFYKRKEDLKNLYSDLRSDEIFRSAVDDEDRLNAFINREAADGKDERSDYLYGQIKRFQNVYTARLVLAYLLRVAGETFHTDAVFGREGPWGRLNLMSFVEDQPDRKRKARGELLLMLSFMKRNRNSFRDHYYKSLDITLRALSNNEKMDSSIGSIADYSAFSMVSGAAMCLIASCELLHTFQEASYEETSKTYRRIYEAIRNQIIDTMTLYKDTRKRCEDLKTYSGKLLGEWWELFDMLFEPETQSRYLSRLIE